MPLPADTLALLTSAFCARGNRPFNSHQMATHRTIRVELVRARKALKARSPRLAARILESVEETMYGCGTYNLPEPIVLCMECEERACDEHSAFCSVDCFDSFWSVFRTGSLHAALGLEVK
jgi:hypothetical protein